MKHIWICFLVLLISTGAVQIAWAESEIKTPPPPRNDTETPAPSNPVQGNSPATSAPAPKKSAPPQGSRSGSARFGPASGGSSSKSGSSSEGNVSSAPQVTAPANQSEVKLTGSNKPFSFGLLAGMGPGTYKNIGGGAIDDSIGFLVSGGAAFNFNFGRLNMEADLLISSDGFSAQYEYEYEYAGTNGVSYGSYTRYSPYKFSATILQIPLLFKYKIGSGFFKFYPLAGLYLNVALTKLEIKYDGGYSYANVDADNLSGKYDYSPSLLGFTIGGGFGLGSRFFLDLRFNIDLGSATSSNLGGSGYKAIICDKSALMFMFGFNF